MIGLKISTGWLALSPGTLTLDISSPYFEWGAVPGTTSYPFGLPLAGNAHALNFPHVRAEQGERVGDEPAEFYIDGTLRWVGALVYQDYDEEKQVLAYTFVAGAADLQSRLDGLTLPALDLGRVPLQLVPDADDYALPCLRNALFYDADQVPYCGVVNYYRAGAYQLAPGGQRSPVVPFPRLVPLLRRVLAAVGYALSGPWLDEPEAQALVLYADRACENADGTLPAEVELNRYVPALGVDVLLVELQKLLALGYDFHPVRRELSIRSLRDVAADEQYLDRAGTPLRTTAVTSQGFVLRMGLEDDELNKTLDTGWTSLRVGAGQQVLETAAGTLHAVREADPNALGRRWLVPAIAAKGASAAFEAGDDSRCGLRLLFDRGLCPDSARALYPLATWGNEDYFEAPVGSSTLRWAGETGLYATRHRAWLDFLDRATTKEMRVAFRVADLLQLDPARKELVNHRKYLWEKVSLSLKTTGGYLETALFTYRYTRL